MFALAFCDAACPIGLIPFTLGTKTQVLGLESSFLIESTAYFYLSQLRGKAEYQFYLACDTPHYEAIALQKDMTLFEKRREAVRVDAGALDRDGFIAIALSKCLCRAG